MSLSSLANNCFIEISSLNDIKKIEKAKQEYKSENIMILFFHYNKDNILADHNLIKEIECKTNMYVNFIDISKVYVEHINIINLLDLYSNKNMKHIRFNVELKNIIENIKDQIVQYKQILEYKG
jgi:hypothetical protein